jgi:hypothetical protein
MVYAIYCTCTYLSALVWILYGVCYILYLHPSIRISRTPSRCMAPRLGAAQSAASVVDSCGARKVLAAPVKVSPAKVMFDTWTQEQQGQERTLLKH